jgi:hypothetical protein
MENIYMHVKACIKMRANKFDSYSSNKLNNKKICLLIFFHILSQRHFFYRDF